MPSSFPVAVQKIFGPFRVSGAFHARLPRSWRIRSSAQAPSRGASPLAGTGSRSSSIEVLRTQRRSSAGSSTRYFTAHAASLELAAPPMVVVGGEASKNDPSLLLRVQSWLQRSRHRPPVGGDDHRRRRGARHGGLRGRDHPPRRAGRATAHHRACLKETRAWA